MHARHLIAALTLLGIAGCRQLLGIEEAALICPPDLPGCKLCDEAADCGPSTACARWTCEDSLCTPVNAPARTPCAQGVCSDDPVSQCVACVENEDCPEGGHCFEDICYRCDDGVQNGREHGVDCGGPCKECLGDPCTSADQCKSGFCADGRCCVTACDDICAYCPNDGNCTALPKFSDDKNPLCDGDQACDGTGGCRNRSGTFCLTDIDCIDFRCIQNVCKELAGAPCNFPWECVDDLCVDGVCVK
jgi:hypothetical protein